MNFYVVLYAVHTCLFLGLGIYNYVSDFSWITVKCPDNQKDADALTEFSKVLGYIYFTCAALSLIVTSLSAYFSKGYLPSELGKLKRMMAVLGAICRISWILLRVVHYALYLFVSIFSLMTLRQPVCIQDQS